LRNFYLPPDRTTWVGDGTSVAALARELESGKKVGEKWHLIKVAGLRNQLDNMERRVLDGSLTLSDADHEILRNHANRVNEALKKVDMNGSMYQQLSKHQRDSVRPAIRAGGSRLATISSPGVPYLPGFSTPRRAGESPMRLPGLGGMTGMGTSVDPGTVLMMMLEAWNPCAFSNCSVPMA
jgi:hypothetical protein